MMETRGHKKARRIAADLTKTRRERLHAKLRAGDLISVSSDAKWRKVLDHLERTLPLDARFRIKLVASDGPSLLDGVHFFHWEGDWFECSAGAYSFEEVEWIAFPAATAPDLPCRVDAEHAEGVMTIYGYRRPGS